MLFKKLNRTQTVATGVLLLLIFTMLSGCSESGSVFGSFFQMVSSEVEVVPDNIVLISIDTLRAERLGSYGFPNGYSATMDRIASKGTVWKTTYTVIPHTTPAHASLLTGLYPAGHGCRDNARPIFLNVPTVAETFQSNDYETFGSVGHFLLSPGTSGLDRGFDHYWSPAAPGAKPGRTDGGKKVFPLVSNAFRPWRKVNSHVKQWMSGAVDPWFVFLHYYECHVPYEPPYPWNRLPGLHPYDAEIAGIDLAISDVMRTLVENDFMDNTELMITADHGESLGEHGYWGHGENLYHPSMSIPWISMGSSSDEPRIVTGMNRIMDIGPDLLARRDMEMPSLMKDETCSENSDLIFGESPSLFADEPQRRIRSVRDSAFSLIYHRNANVTELYNLKNDPGETRNIANRAPAKTSEYIGYIDAFIENDTQPIQHPKEMLSPEVKEALQSLGYMGF